MQIRSRRARPRRVAPLVASVGACVLMLASLGCGDTAVGTAASHDPGPRRAQGPLASLRLYVRPDNPAAAQATVWRSAGLVKDADAIEQIAREPTAKWLTGGQQHEGAVASALVTAAARARATPQLVLYDIPDRDCHGYSSGGAPGPRAYRAWVAAVVKAIGQHSVIVIVEPDAIDQAADGCLSPQQAQERYRLLAGAIGALRADRHAHVYLDAGNAGWLAPGAVAAPLRKSDIHAAAGFSLNVANFQSTTASIAYGDRLSKLLGGAHFVIDTGRSGAGPPYGAPGVDSWCNPPGRAIGTAPTTDTGHRLVDAYLWVKYPGESDGACAAGQPPAGTWWASYALGLVQRADAIARATGHPSNGLTSTAASGS